MSFSPQPTTEVGSRYGKPATRGRCSRSPRSQERERRLRRRASRSVETARSSRPRTTTARSGSGTSATLSIRAPRAAFKAQEGQYVRARGLLSPPRQVAGGWRRRRDRRALRRARPRAREANRADARPRQRRLAAGVLARRPRLGHGVRRGRRSPLGRGGETSAWLELFQAHSRVARRTSTSTGSHSPRMADWFRAGKEILSSPGIQHSGATTPRPCGQPPATWRGRTSGGTMGVLLPGHEHRGLQAQDLPRVPAAAGLA